MTQEASFKVRVNYNLESIHHQGLTPSRSNTGVRPLHYQSPGSDPKTER